MLCCFYCFLVHNRNLRCSFLFVILNRFVFDIFNIFSSDKVIFPVPSHFCHLMPVYLLTDWIFSRRSLLESSTATEQPLRHRRPALGFTSANLVRNKGFSSAPPLGECVCGSATRFYCLRGKWCMWSVKMSRRASVCGWETNSGSRGNDESQCFMCHFGSVLLTALVYATRDMKRCMVGF